MFTCNECRISFGIGSGELSSLVALELGFDLRLHLLQRAMPDLTIVPAHDRRVMNTLPPATRADAVK